MGLICIKESIWENLEESCLGSAGHKKRTFVLNRERTTIWGKVVTQESSKSIEPGSQSKGARTRETILAKSSRIAAAEGLGAITIGRLARELGMTKSGIFAHFGSKENLQLETIGTARQLFHEEVMDPAQKSEGIARVWALCDL
jgi:hypothetical protein